MMKEIVNMVPKIPKGKTTFEDPKREEAKLHIFDARSKIAAFGMRVNNNEKNHIDCRFRNRKCIGLQSNLVNVL